MTTAKTTIKVELENNGIDSVPVASFISFNNPSFLHGLQLMFDKKPHEKITGIEITQEGIKAHFKSVR